MNDVMTETAMTEAEFAELCCEFDADPPPPAEPPACDILPGDLAIGGAAWRAGTPLGVAADYLEEAGKAWGPMWRLLTGSHDGDPYLMLSARETRDLLAVASAGDRPDDEGFQVLAAHYRHWRGERRAARGRWAAEPLLHPFGGDTVGRWRFEIAPSFDAILGDFDLNFDMADG